MSRVFRAVALVILLIFADGCGRPPAKTPETPRPTPIPANAIGIGVFLPLTGDQAPFGTAALDGLKLAVDDVNAAGGVLGRPLALHVRDCASSSGPGEAVRTLAGEKVAVLIGPVTSADALAAAPVAVASGIPLVVPGATHPDVTKAGPTVFRTCYVDPFPGIVMSKFASSIGATRAAVLFDPSSVYARELADSFVSDFESRGGRVVVKAEYSSQSADFASALDAVKSATPEVVFLPGYFHEAAMIIKQARAAGLDVPFLGTDGWESGEFLKAGGEQLNNTYFASHFSAGDHAERAAGFVAAFKKRYGRDPEALAALGYDALDFVADGLRRAGTSDGTALAAALGATSGFHGVTGDITMDPSRNPRKPAIVLRVSGGKFNYLETVAP